MLSIIHVSIINGMLTKPTSFDLYKTECGEKQEKVCVKKYVYLFRRGNARHADLLGGKGASW